MTDTTVDQGEPSTMLRVPIVKAKTTIEVDTGQLPNHVYQEALVRGLKVLMNLGQTGFTKEKYPDPDELQKVALEKAEAVLQDLYAGKVRIMGGAKADKVPREVMTSARNMARKIVKEALKRKGVKVTQVKASDITKAANTYLGAHPELIDKARKEQEELEKADLDIDTGGIEVDPKLVAAQVKRQADKTLSAKQAGKVAGRVIR